MIALRLIPRFLGMVWRVRPAYAAAILSFRVLLAFSPAVQLWIGKLIIDGVLANIEATTPDWTGLFRLVALELVVALASDVLQRTSNLLESLLGDLFGNRLSIQIMEHAATLDLENFEDPEFYDSLQRARQQTVGRIGLLAVLLGIGQSALSLVTLLGVLIVFNGWLVLMLVLAVLPSFIGETHFAGLSYSLLFKWTPERRELDYLRYVATSDVTAKEVKLFGLADYFTRKYERLADEFYEANRDLSIKRAATSGGLTVVSTLGYYAAYVFIIVDTVRGFLTLGELTMLVGTFRQSRGMISGILLRSADMYRQSLFLRDLFTFLEMKPRTASPEHPVPVPRPIRDGVVFENVGFRYPDKEDWALRGVSLRIGANERVALVGENGAGKTTLVKLLARLYDPTEGRILLDGIDLREYDVDELRGMIGVIFQDFVRYDLKVRENIAVGQIDAIGDQPRIVRAAEMSLADGVIAGLESGLDHMLGRRFKGGANLSGGEWQKVGLARAYMRDAQILILDEPTASLDARAEYQVFERFADLTEGRMAVLISHRFSTVRMADRIVVLEDGTVTEDGTHDELLVLSGRYAELFTLQAAGYR